jgi:hypothetical protein
VLILKCPSWENTLTQSSSHGHSAGEKRRSTRVLKAVPITVKGTDALGQTFKEFTATVMVNCYGCKFQSRHYVPKNSVITIEVQHPQRKLSPRIIRGRVIWVQRPRTFREAFHIGMEFDVPGNVWDVEVPPRDWFPHPEDEELVIPVFPKTGEPEPVAAPASARHVEKSEVVVERRTAPRPALVEAAESQASSGSAKTLAMPRVTAQHEPQLAISQESLKAAAQHAVAEELARMRPQLDAQLQHSLDECVRTLIERVAEAAAKDVVAQVAERTASAVEDARQACQAAAEHLDGKIRKAVEEALAAQQTNPYKTPARRKRRPRF